MKCSSSAGVVVGRFQVPELHEGHKHLISMAQLNHVKLLVFIACTEVKGSNRDPLDYKTRAAMVKYQFPDAIINPIYDQPLDSTWSFMLDGMITKEIGRKEALLYSSKNGFHDAYCGKYKVNYVKEIDFYRGTELREIQGLIVPTTKEGRCGVIYGITNQYPRVYPTVDAAVLKVDEGKTKVLLGIKKGQLGLRFPGGFVDPNDPSLEYAARREVWEECGKIETDDYEYVCSGIVDDWRYRNRPEKIMSTFFKCKYGWGEYSSACKELDAEFEKLQFYPVDLATAHRMAMTHKDFYMALLKNIKQTKVDTNGIFDK